MMTPDEFRAAIERLGYTQTGFASFVRVHERSVRRWASGEHAVPGWVEVVLRLMALVTPPEHS